MKKIYSEEFKNVLIHTRTEAYKGTEKLIRADHFVLGMLHAPDNDAYELIASKTEALEALRSEMKDHLKTYSPAHVPFDMPEGAINLDMDASVALQGSMDESNKMRTDKVMSIHLLLALIRDKETFMSQTLAKYGITYEYARSRAYDLYHIDENDSLAIDIKEALFSGDDDDFEEEEEEEDEQEGMEDKELLERLIRSDKSHDQPLSEKAKTLRGGILFMDKKKSAKSLEFLSRYANDMTADVMAGKIDPIVGREKEIERLSQILSRRKKNNPILIGEAGVGKTAIVEGLARNIVNGEVPVALRDKRIFSLNMAAVVAGTKYRGQFEERLQGLVKELHEHPEIILFIDEIHNIIGAGSSQGTMDAANLLKPALSRGRLQCIGATTIDEYRKTIEKDGALERRFQKIMVNPTTPDETITILNNIKEVYEVFHSVSYTDKAIEACVRLTDRYISDRKLPDKAIDALDEAGSRKHMTGVKMPDELKNIEKEIALCKEQKREAVNSKHFEEANALRDKISELQDKFGDKKAQWLISLRENPIVVDEKD
ncbi:MAG: AAA family ATPase, partial [Bacteroidaceae bacterium]